MLKAGLIQFHHMTEAALRLAGQVKGVAVVHGLQVLLAEHGFQSALGVGTVLACHRQGQLRCARAQAPLSRQRVEDSRLIRHAYVPCQR